MTAWTQTRLLALVVTALCCVPNFAHLPRVCALLAAASMCVSGLTRMYVLPRAITTMVVLVTVWGVYFMDRWTPTAGLTVVVLLACQKLFDLRSARDITVLLALDLFLMAAAMGGMSSNLVAIGGMGVVLLAMVAQVSPDPGEYAIPLKARLRTAIKAISLGLPVALSLVLLLPLPESGKWLGGGKLAHGTGTTGLSDTLEPGNVADLKDSADLAFVVKFQGDTPQKRSLYWRAEVLPDYDGIRWYRIKAGQPQRPERQDEPRRLRVFGEPVAYELMMSRSPRKWVPALAAPTHVSAALAPLEPAVDGDMLVRTRRSFPGVMAYRMTTYPSYLAGVATEPSELARYLALPAGRNPRTVALGREMRQASLTAEETVSRALRYLRENNFVYTRRPGLMDGEQVDQFMFARRAGFCEHYASAFAVLMRASGVPSRVVVGYHGGTSNSDGQETYMAVFQSDAHAWVEVWIAGRGWTRVDPTTQASIQDDTGASALIARMWNADITRSAMFALTAWLDAAPRLWPGLAVAGMTLALSVGLVWALRRRRAISDQGQVLYDVYCRRMARKGLARAVHEGPTAYADRLSLLLVPEQAVAAREFLGAYAKLRYGRPDGYAMELRRMRASLGKAAPRRWKDYLGF